MNKLKTKCEGCDKNLTPDKWEQVDYPIYCSQECEQQADKEMHEYFQSRMNK
jgi:hypothetical protein